MANLDSTASTKLPKEQFIKKYGSVKMKFAYYYKYEFSYFAELPDGTRLYCRYGGIADEIYRYEVIPSEFPTLREVDPSRAWTMLGDKEIEFFDGEN